MLQPDEFQMLLESCGFGFDEETIQMLIDAADTNHDGVIEYNEFVPAMLGIMEAMQSLAEERLESQTPSLLAYEFMLLDDGPFPSSIVMHS